MAPQSLYTPGAQGSRCRAHQSELPLPLSLPIARTRDPQIPRGAECSQKESLNLSVYPKPILNKDHILYMYA